MVLAAQIQNTNWQIVNCSTPANYFHVLRRQIKRSFRKPLVVVSPKSLLRHPLCVSPLSDFLEDHRFQRAYDERFPDELKTPAEVMHPPTHQPTNPPAPRLAGHQVPDSECRAPAVILSQAKIDACARRHPPHPLYGGWVRRTGL